MHHIHTVRIHTTSENLYWDHEVDAIYDLCMFEELQNVEVVVALSDLYKYVDGQYKIVAAFAERKLPGLGEREVEMAKEIESCFNFRGTSVRVKFLRKLVHYEELEIEGWSRTRFCADHSN